MKEVEGKGRGRGIGREIRYISPFSCCWYSSFSSYSLVFSGVFVFETAHDKIFACLLAVLVFFSFLLSLFPMGYGNLFLSLLLLLRTGLLLGLTIGF